jgi:hypothetical protein
MLQLSEQDEQNSTMVHMKAELSEAISGRVLPLIYSKVDFFTENFICYGIQNTGTEKM